MDMTTAPRTRATRLLPLGDMLFSDERRGQPLQKWRGFFGFDRPPGPTRIRGDGARADDRLAQAALQDGDSTGSGNGKTRSSLRIGQGDLTVTRCRWARFYACLANGGQARHGRTC